MPRLKRLSGDDVITIMGHFGFKVHSQRGSHVKLRRVARTGQTQILTIPRHRELHTGTLHAILRQASRFVSEQELRPYFYSD